LRCRMRNCQKVSDALPSRKSLPSNNNTYIEPAHSGLQHQTTAQTHSGKFLYIEIECCKNLKEPDFALTNSALPDPFIIVKLGGVEIARTKTIYNKVNPVWYEECFEVPAILYKTQAGDNKQIMIEGESKRRGEAAIFYLPYSTQFNSNSFVSRSLRFASLQFGT